jgi:hypothetical protein
MTALVAIEGERCDLPLSELVTARPAGIGFTAGKKVAVYYPRTRLDEKHIASLVEAGPDAWPPLLVGRYPDGRLQLLDGHHRLEAAKRLKLDRVRCRIVTVPGTEEAFTIAVEANLIHGLPYTPADRARNVAILYYLQERDRSEEVSEDAPSLRSFALQHGVSPQLLWWHVRKIEQRHGDMRRRRHIRQAAAEQEWFSARRPAPDAGRLVLRTLDRLWEERRSFLDRLRSPDAADERIAADLAKAIRQLPEQEAALVSRRLALVVRALGT